MFTITNPKISGFIPKWSAFHGFSILFDNPGSSLHPMSNKHQLLHNDLASKELELYKTLHHTLTSYSEILNAYMFCPLPKESYHVTLWDGINDANVQEVNISYRADAEYFLQDLPHSLSDGKQMHAIKSLSLEMADSIEFKYGQLVKWDNSVLAVKLLPADSPSEAALLQLEEKRKILIQSFSESFELDTCSYTYTPHVSLGYFANKQLADLTTEQVDEWNKQFETDTKGQTIRFSSNSLYGFTSMDTFFKE
ncbi:hypothetical protein M3231_25185 [Neobacillus mesonae]|nr:hypothetical protein [Neobacillus mesonae]